MEEKIMDKYPENNLNEQPKNAEAVEGGNAPETVENEKVNVESQAEAPNTANTQIPNTYAQNPNMAWQNRNPNENPNMAWQNQNPNPNMAWQNQNPNPNMNWQNQNPNVNWQNPNFNGQYVQTPVEAPGKGLGIAGFVFSLCSFVGCCIHPIIMFACIIAGMVLSIVGRVQSKKAGAKNGLATAGMVISIVHLVLWVLLIAFVVIMMLVFGPEFFEEYATFYNEFSVSM